MDRRKFMQAAAVGAAAVGASATEAAAQKSSIPMIDTHVHLYDPTRPQGIPWPNKEQPASIYRRFLPGDYAKIAEPHGVVGAIETGAPPTGAGSGPEASVAWPSPTSVRKSGGVTSSSAVDRTFVAVIETG